MRRNKNTMFGILALFAGVVAVGFVYAGFTQSLNINGTGNVVASKWDIYFANLANAVTTGTANVVTPATINPKTKIGDYYVELASPGDSVTYTFDVVNDGDFDAVLSTLTKNTPTCSPSAALCNYLSYTLRYTSNGAPVLQNDKLLKKETKNMTLKLMLDSNMPASALSTTTITISNLGITLLYSQDSGYGGNSPVPDPDYLFSVAEYPGYRNGDQISINNTDVFGSKNAALTAFGTPFFTAFSVNGSNEIENYYIGVMSHGNTYYLQGGGASFVGYDYESGCNYDSVYFQSNISVLNEAFGSNNCQGDELHYTCYLPEYLYVDVDAAGNIYISDNNHHTCNTMCGSTTWCEIVQEP